MSDQDDGPRVRSGEWRAAALSFVYFFCVLAAYYMIRPVRDQLSAVVGSTQLPWFYAATFLSLLALTPVFAWLASRYSRRVVVPVVYVFFIGCLLAFVPFFADESLLGARTLGTIFFVWISVFNLFVVSVFWSFMADIWSHEQARRLFSLIAIGGTAGAIAGPVLTRAVVGVIGVAPLLVLSACLLGVALVCILLLNAWARRHGARRHIAGHDAAVGGSMWDGLKQVFADPFMRNMAILLLLGDCIGTINYALVIDYSKATFDNAVARTQFAADLDTYTNLLTFAMQLLVTRWLLVRFGPWLAIALWSVVATTVLLIALLSADAYRPVIGAMPWVAIALIVSRGFAYGVLGPARESLFTRVARSQRYKGKNAVDTAVWRFGDVAIASVMNGLRQLGMAGASFAGLGAIAAATAGVVGVRLARRIGRDERRDVEQPATP